jgi:hypothetical protein
MNIIKQNPFRILGLTGNATEKELQKQIGIIKRYAEVGKTKSFDYDFEFIGEFTRTLDEIQQASNRIEQANKKLLYSLFWFVKNNQFDEIAFNNLKESDTEKAIEIWGKTLKEDVTNKNYSSYLNLSTLYIALSTIDDQIELQKLQIGISLKGNLIHSENLKDFSQLVTGNGIANDTIEISKKFVDEIIELLKPYLNKRNGISTKNLISLFKTFPASIKKYVSAKFTEIPISSIENKIEKTARKRKDNPRDAAKQGEKLYKSTKSDIILLNMLMGASHVQFQMIANKLSNELLECSIVFYNHRNENSTDDFDPFEDALKIAKYAKSIGSTGQAKNRIDEAITTLEDMRFRDAFQLISFLKEIIELFDDVKKNNSDIQAIISGTITSVNESKVIKMIKPIFTNQLVMKIANSNKDNLINDFDRTLNKIIVLFSFAYFDFFKKKKDVFISNLPTKNSIRKKFEKEEIDEEISVLQNKLSKTKSEQYYSSELKNLKNQMASIKTWQLFRGRETREKQISDKQQEINRIIAKGENEKKRDISSIEEQLVIKRRELKRIK